MKKERLQELAGIPLTEAMSEVEEEKAEKRLYNEIRRQLKGMRRVMADDGIKNDTLKWHIQTVEDALADLENLHRGV